MTKLLSLKVPATSANLGPGFDSMGLALDLWNTFELSTIDGERRTDDAANVVRHSSRNVPEAARSGFVVESHGEGEGILPNDRSHLVVRTMIEELTMHAPFDIQNAGYQIVCNNCVPCGSGLGSSSTAVLAGLIFARALLEPKTFFDDEGKECILARAFELEGHGDNVAPALLGGLVVVTAKENRVLSRKIEMKPMKLVVCVPDFHFLTAHARSVLPTSYSRSDAVFNIARASLVIDALRRGDLGLLAHAMEDRIHEPYRLPAIPGAVQAKQAALLAGAGCVSLSGAGPGLLAFAQENHEVIGNAMRHAFAEFGLTARFWVLDVSQLGAHISVVG
jgi:homoserine kinase